MFFHLLADYINVFRYLSFRSIGAAVTAFLLVLWIAPYVINKLREMKFGQQVREEGPSAHLAKTGTPTMGGVFMWGVAIVASLLWAPWNGFVLIVCLTILLYATIGFIDDFAKIKQKNTKGLTPRQKLAIQSLSALIVLTLLYMMPQYHKKNSSYTISFVDQQQTPYFSTNVNMLEEWSVGYSPRFDQGEIDVVGVQYNPETGKLLKTDLFKISNQTEQENHIYYVSSKIIQNNGYQVLADITMTSADIEEIPYHYEMISLTNIYKARLFSSFFIPMYTEVVWYWPLWLAMLFFIFIIVGVSNATNLSDGLDGLATGMGISFYLPFGVFAYLMGNTLLSSYLFYPYIPGVGELTICIAAIIGAFAGFLWYNVHPAEVFMGDTGSLPMGATIAVIAIMVKQEVLLIVAGFMFVLETVSVILQVFWFKRFKTRIFKMAPIHHHFELSGWKENQVVVRFWILSVLFAILALATIKIR